MRSIMSATKRWRLVVKVAWSLGLTGCCQVFTCCEACQCPCDNSGTCEDQVLSSATPNDPALSGWTPPPNHGVLPVLDPSFEQPIVTESAGYRTDVAASAFNVDANGNPATPVTWTNGTVDLHDNLVAHGDQIIDLNTTDSSVITLTVPGNLGPFAGTQGRLHFFYGLNGQCTDRASFRVTSSDTTFTGGTTDLSYTCGDLGNKLRPSDDITFTFPADGRDVTFAFQSTSGGSCGPTLDDMRVAYQCPEISVSQVVNSGNPHVVAGRMYPWLRYALKVLSGESFAVTAKTGNDQHAPKGLFIEGPLDSSGKGTVRLVSTSTSTNQWLPANASALDAAALGGTGLYRIHACTDQQSPNDAFVEVASPRTTSPTRGIGVFWARWIDKNNIVDAGGTQCSPLYPGCGPLPALLRQQPASALVQRWRDRWDLTSLKWAQCAGANSTHLSFDWVDSQPNGPNATSWSSAQRQLTFGQAAGLQDFLVFTGTTPSWALPGQPADPKQCPPDDTATRRQQFQDFFGQLAGHFCASANLKYEFFNEPNGNGSFRSDECFPNAPDTCSWPDPTSGSYVSCLWPPNDPQAQCDPNCAARANFYTSWMNDWYDAMKNSCSSAVLSVGGLDCNGCDNSAGCPNFLNSIVTANGKLDAVSIHPYSSCQPDWVVNWYAIQQVLEATDPKNPNIQNNQNTRNKSLSIYLDEWSVQPGSDPALIDQFFQTLDHPMYDRVTMTRYLTLTDFELNGGDAGLVTTMKTWTDDGSGMPPELTALDTVARWRSPPSTSLDTTCPAETTQLIQRFQRPRP